MSEALRTLRAEPLRRFKPYPTYKDSGVEWLGEIPAHWDVKRLKYVAPARISKLQVKPDNAVYVGLEHIESWTGRLLLENQPETVDSVVGSFKAGDVLFGKLRPYLAKVARPDFDGVCTSEILPLRPADECAQSYLMYALLNAPYIYWLDSLTYGTKMPRVSPEQVAVSFVSLPPEPEQRAIAAFLDRETARIDALVAKKARLIELLHEKRTALITRAVTKGLDPTVPMKDSGVEWLGEIPVHWEVKPVGAVADSLVGFPFPSDDFSFDEGTRLLRGDNITTESLRWGDKTRAWRKPAPHPRYYLKAGDVVIGMDGSKVGRNYAVVREEDLPLLLVQRVTRLRARRTVLPEFLFFSIAGPRFHAHVDTCKSDPAIPHITLKNIESFLIAVPPKSEQLAIHDKIQSEAGTLTALLERVRDAIDRLMEFRTALISAAVTGKIDVREEIV